jgi:hypothetical protein
MVMVEWGSSTRLHTRTHLPVNWLQYTGSKMPSQWGIVLFASRDFPEKKSKTTLPKEKQKAKKPGILRNYRYLTLMQIFFYGFLASCFGSFCN